MSEDKPKKKRKKKAATEENGGEKEHKPNWREVYATIREIKTFLSDHVYLRYNVVKHQVEARLPEEDPFFANEEFRQFVTGKWQLMSDRLYKTLLSALQTVKPTREKDLETVIGSGFVPQFHPFLHYLNRLPPWDGGNHILLLSASVTVKGGPEMQMRFYEYLRKWLVAMVAGWLDEEVVNQTVLVFIGEQGLYKTTWFQYLLPPELRHYFRIKVNSSRIDRDDLIALSQYGLVCYEELDTMQPWQVNTMKSVVTMPSIDERRPFGRYTEHMEHIASFCGTGNNVMFLNDATGNRRWLPFEVESIENPRDHPFDYEGIYAEAYALYRQGFCHYFTKAEEEALKEHNCQFETPKDEQELVDYYFRQPSGTDAGEFLPTAIARQIVSSPGMSVSTVALGRAFCKQGFRGGVENNCRGYYVVRRTEEERRMRARSLAFDNRQMTDDTDDL